MPILVEDVLVLLCLAVLCHASGPLPVLHLLLLASAAVLWALLEDPKAERRGGVIFATLLGPLLACAYQEEATNHAGDAANSILWVLASAQTMGNLVLPPAVVAMVATAVATGCVGLSVWPSVAFLAVHQLGLWRAKTSSYAHCFSLAEVMFWSQGSGFVASLTIKGMLEAFQFWRPICTFWVCLAATGLVFLLLTACFQSLGGLAPLLASLVAAVLFLTWGLSPAVPGGAIWWFLQYILQWQNLRLLVFVWPALLGAGLIAIEILSRQLVDSSEPSLLQKHLLRKSFHLLAICLFSPSLFLFGQPGVEFLALAQLVAALLFIALEVCRASRAPLCHIQDRFLSKYLDKREDITRDLVLTHLYLLLGCSLPVWLEAFGTAGDLRWAGLLMIGVGDSCAAILGIRFGQRRWPGSHRTLVGSLAFVVSVLCSAWMVATLKAEAMLPFLLTTVLTALLEVYTKTIDNLSLPLFFCAFLKVLEMHQGVSSGS